MITAVVQVAVVVVVYLWCRYCAKRFGNSSYQWRVFLGFAVFSVAMIVFDLTAADPVLYAAAIFAYIGWVGGLWVGYNCGWRDGARADIEVTLEFVNEEFDRVRKAPMN